MINLNDIVQSAHGGQGIDTLASRFGLTPAQAQSAVDALLPALQMGLQNKIETGGLSAILAHLSHGANTASSQDAATTQSSTAATQGGAVLGDVFGQQGTIAAIVQQVAQKTGIPVSVLQGMLPVIATMVMSGLGRAGQGGGLGGILSSVLGSVLGQGATASGGGGLGGVLGGLFGGGGASGPQTGAIASQPAAAPAAPADAPPADGSASAADTLSEISTMITAGTPPAPEHEAALASIVRR